MKTIRKNDEIIRVKDEQADAFLKKGYSFCSKKTWKTDVRDLNKKKKEADKA